MIWRMVSFTSTFFSPPREWPALDHSSILFPQKHHFSHYIRPHLREKPCMAERDRVNLVDKFFPVATFPPSQTHAQSHNNKNTISDAAAADIWNSV